MSKTILVTGSSGFTGRYIIDALKKANYDVVGLVHTHPGIGDVVCDLRDKKTVIETIGALRPDGIIHLAALSFVGHPNPDEFYSVNVIGTENLIEATVVNNLALDKFIIASSANVYGNQCLTDIIDECVTPAPINHYAISKLAMEYMAKTWWDKVPIILTRPFNYTGVGQHINFVIPKIVSAYKNKQKTIQLGNINVYRDFSNVKDVATGYLKLLCCDESSEIVNICSGMVYSLSDVISIMNEISGYEMNVDVNPDFVRKNEVNILTGDNGKLLKITNFVPSIPLNKTLLDMYKS